MSILYFIGFTLLTIIGWILHRGVFILNPVCGFLLFNWILGTGVFLLTDAHKKSDFIHMNLTVLTLLFLILGSLFAIKLLNIEKKYKLFWIKDIENDRNRNRNIMIGFFIFSIVMSVIYYQVVGYNLFFRTIRGVGVDDYTTMRLASYAGDNYFAPGYINQFKNTILPMLFVYFVLIIKNIKYKIFFILVFGFIVLYSLLGTGQRTFLVTFFLMIIFSIWSLKKGKFNLKLVGIASVVLVFLFGFTSVNLGRTEEFNLYLVLESLVYRIFGSNQLSSVVGFDYIYNVKGVEYLKDWSQGVLGLLPGVKGSNIANEVHYLLFGSERGTAPLSIWGSFYYNLGFLGALIGAFIMGFLYQLSYYKFLGGFSSNLRVILYSVLFMYFSIWVAGSPIQLLNNGILAVIFLLLIRKIKG